MRFTLQFVPHRVRRPPTIGRAASTVSHVRSSAGIVPPPTPPLTVAHYWDTAVPTPTQLLKAERFFNRPSPCLLYSSTDFRNVKTSSLPEVAFLGRSNVGKSSLLNTLMGRYLCHTSKKPGRTRSMNFFAVGGEDGMGNPGRIVLLDMPGYGKGSHAEWGKEIMKYLVGRKQYDYLVYIRMWRKQADNLNRLKRAFLLVDAKHGLKQTDKELLEMFRQHAISHQVVLSKADRIVCGGPKAPTDQQLHLRSESLRGICENIREAIQPAHSEGPVALGELIACSAEKSIDGKRLGINHLRWAVLAATGLLNPANGVSKALPTHDLSYRSYTNRTESLQSGQWGIQGPSDS